MSWPVAIFFRAKLFTRPSSVCFSCARLHTLRGGNKPLKWKIRNSHNSKTRSVAYLAQGPKLCGQRELHCVGLKCDMSVDKVSLQCGCCSMRRIPNARQNSISERAGVRKDDTTRVLVIQLWQRICTTLFRVLYKRRMFSALGTDLKRYTALRYGKGKATAKAKSSESD